MLVRRRVIVYMRLSEVLVGQRPPLIVRDVRPAIIVIFLSFFFQAEDGIRDGTVTGVQTCALPICSNRRSDPLSDHEPRQEDDDRAENPQLHQPRLNLAEEDGLGVERTLHRVVALDRSEERRVGKESSSQFVRGGYTRLLGLLSACG